MDDFTKILLTSALTALGAITVFVISQLLGKLVIEPIQEFKKLLGELRYALVFHAPAAVTPVGDRASEDMAAEAFRRLACELLSKLESVPFYDFWSNISAGFLPRRNDVIEVSKCLIGLSNSVHQENRSDKNSARISRIKRIFGFELLDDS
ncbi:MAG: hypothetical protein V4451_04235 [Pseudomonadota bacterium]